MEIVVNGKNQTTPPCSIGDYLRNLGLDPQGVVVEHNHGVVGAEQWDNIALAANDHLEILSFVGGG